MKSMLLQPPVHVHLPEVAELHVYMKKNTSKSSQSQASGQRSKVLKPWIPPGKVVQPSQSSSPYAQKCRPHSQTEPQEDLSSHVLLTQQENVGHSKKWSSECEHTDHLLRALVEAEIDGVAVANQLLTLTETINTGSKDQCVHASVKRQQELLMEKITMFDHTNVHLGELLRKRRSLVSEQEEALKSRFVISKVENNRLSVKLSHRQTEILELTQRLDSEKDNRRIKEELSHILDSTTDHLQSQLNRALQDQGHLETHIQEVQQNLRSQGEELAALEEELEKVKKEKQQQEALVLLTQQTLSAQEMLSAAVSTSSDWCHRHSEEETAKKHLEEQISVLSSEQTELLLLEEKSGMEQDQLRKRFQHLSSENTSITLENQQLQGKLTSTEDQNRKLRVEAAQLKSSMKKIKNHVEKYKRKVQQVRLEAEENFLKLEETQKEAQEVDACFQREKEQLMQRLRELEAFPDRVKRTDEQIRETQEKTRVHERSSTESCAALTHVRHKVEQQGSELETFHQKNSELQMENKYLKEKMLNLERTLGGMKVENSELSQTLCVKEASVCNIQQQIDDRTRECSVLSAQIKQALEDAQRQVDGGIHRVLSKERRSQSKAVDVQTQLIRASAELAQLQQSNEQMERHFQTQLRNVKQRLGQSDSTNHSLHSYVHFLKTSYGNVFGSS